jgi:signal transduction histidine kinase/tetratricopeptide (TPR) repeat protein
MSKKKGDVKAQCLAVNLKGEYYYFKNDLRSLLAERTKIINFAVKTPYKQYVFGVWNRVIAIYLIRGDIATALDEIKKFQKEALALNEPYAIGLAYKHLSDVYLLQGDYEQSVNELNKAVDYETANGKKNELYTLYNSIGHTYLYWGKYDLSAKYFKLGLQNSPTETAKGTNYLQLARIALLNKDLEESERYFSLLKNWERSYTLNPASRFSKYEFLIDYYVSLKEYDKAFVYCDSLEGLGKDKALSSIYAKMGNYKNAYDSYLKFSKAERETFNDNLKSNLAQFTAYYDNERFENEKNKLALNNSRLALEKLEIKDKLLASEKAGNALALSNANLELRNNHLTLLAQKSQVEKQKMEASRQHLLAVNAQQKALNMKAIIILMVLVFLILLGASLAYAAQRHAAAKRLLEEVKKGKRAQAEAERANEMKSRFIQNMSHEIRTPLNAIIGFTDLLNDPSSNLQQPEKESFAKLVHDNGNLLVTLINDVLDLSKLESGTYEIKYATTSASELCKQAINSVMNRAANGVRLYFRTPAEDTVFETDPKRVLQILINLLTNACKCTEKGSIELAYKKEADKICFSVTDTGCGIPAEDAEKIFDRFEKLDKFKQGTGLGLNICRQITKLLRGKIYLDTSYTGGARFIFEQPLRQEG